ncbi:MAG: MATE family efflux transporter [Treponema sp.]|jgi:putative MATE family efflux protein|nr:MATE family efflux transporter [Treponema sp.]
MTRNLTVGNPSLLIVSFAAPLFVGNLFQQFYNMADVFIVGRTLGVNALAAVGSTGSMNFLVLGFLINSTQGAAIVTAQRFGAQDLPGVRRSFAASAVLGVMITFVLMFTSIFFCRPFLALLGTPAEIAEAALSYIMVIYWGMPAALLFNLCSNMMRAVGDSRTPLVILVFACVLNIILDYTFILVFHTGVEGAAYATVIAQLASGLLCFPVMAARFPMFRVSRSDRRVTAGELWTHVRIAIPMGFQMSVIAMGSVTVTFALNRLGALTVAAFTASQKIDMLVNLPLGSLGAAMATYSAQNYGARKLDRIKTGVKSALRMALSFSMLTGLVYVFFGRFLSALFLGSEEAAVSMSHTYLKVAGMSYIFLAWLFVLRQTLQGLGNSFIPTVAGITELCMRTFAAIVLSELFGFTGLCFASPLAWAGGCIPLTIAMALTLKKINRKILKGCP